MYKDLFDKAKKLGISRYQLGSYLFGKAKYRLIYWWDRETPTMKKRKQKLEEAINVLQRRKKCVQKRIVKSKKSSNPCKKN